MIEKDVTWVGGRDASRAGMGTVFLCPGGAVWGHDLGVQSGTYDLGVLSGVMTWGCSLGLMTWGCHLGS